MIKPRGSIFDVQMCCPRCGWIGRAGHTEPDADGDGSLGCPVIGCDGIANIIEVEEVEPREP